jgi:hypothetical protein
LAANPEFAGERGDATMASTVILFLALILLLTAAVACALAPLLAFALMLWNWRNPTPDVRPTREHGPE